MPQGSHVYVIGCPAPSRGPVKIGWTAGDPQHRLGQLRTGDGSITPEGVNRQGLQVLYSCPGDRSLERALHYRFRQLRLVGEWFRLEPIVAPREVRMAIAEMRPMVSTAPAKAKQQVATQVVVEDVTLTDVVSAEQLHRKFKALNAAGFTEDQALKLIAYTMRDEVASRTT